MKKAKPEPSVAPPGTAVLGRLVEILESALCYAVDASIEEDRFIVVPGTDSSPPYVIVKSEEEAHAIGIVCGKRMLPLSTFSARVPDTGETLRSQNNEQTD